MTINPADITSEQIDAHIETVLRAAGLTEEMAGKLEANMDSQGDFVKRMAYGRLLNALFVEMMKSLRLAERFEIGGFTFFGKPPSTRAEFVTVMKTVCAHGLPEMAKIHLTQPAQASEGYRMTMQDERKSAGTPAALRPPDVNFVVRTLSPQRRVVASQLIAIDLNYNAQPG